MVTELGNKLRFKKKKNQTAKAKKRIRVSEEEKHYCDHCQMKSMKPISDPQNNFYF